MGTCELIRASRERLSRKRNRRPVLAFLFFCTFAHQLTHQHLRRTSEVKGLLGKVFFINLRERQDRRSAIEKQLAMAALDGERIEAVAIREQVGVDACWGNKYCAGQVGCQISHMRALKHAMLDQLPSVIIFEDDFSWSSHVDIWRIHDILTGVQCAVPDWDVIAISLNILQSTPVPGKRSVRVSSTNESVIVRIIEAQATHGYMVKGSYIANIYRAFKDCDILGQPLTAIDTCWKPLQQTGKWYGLSPQLGYQAPGFSDIEGKRVHYNIR